MREVQDETNGLVHGTASTVDEGAHNDSIRYGRVIGECDSGTRKWWRVEMQNQGWRLEIGDWKLSLDRVERGASHAREEKKQVETCQCEERSEVRLLFAN